MPKKYQFIKDNAEDKVWWLDNYDIIGEHVFSFDKKKTYNLFRDYPHKLTVREWLIFNAENEYWKDFFRDQNDLYELEHAKETIELIAMSDE